MCYEVSGTDVLVLEDLTQITIDGIIDEHPYYITGLLNMSTSNLSLIYLGNYLVDGQLTNYVGSAFSTHYFRTIPDRLEVAIEAYQLETRVSQYIPSEASTKSDKAG